MSLPPSTLTVPGLYSDQLWFRNLRMGAGTPFYIKQLEGLDKADDRSGNTVRPQFRGAYVGVNLLGTRKITATLDVGPPFTGTYSGLADTLAALTVATGTEGTTEYPLWVQLPTASFPLFCCMARVIRKSGNYDMSADLGQLVQNIALQWEATDPAFYLAPTVAYDLSTGGATVANYGDLPCYPVTTITGPVTNPAISISTAGTPSLEFSTALGAGDVLVIDHDMQSAVLNGGNALSALKPGSKFWTLPADGTGYTVAYSGGGGTCSIDVTSVYSGIV